MNKTVLLNRTRRPDITFCSSGRISITSRVAKSLSLAAGDAINIAVCNGEYLLHAIHGCKGRYVGQCWPTKKNSRHYYAYSVHLCRNLFESLNITANRVSFYVGSLISDNDTTYLPIITRNPLYD